MTGINFLSQKSINSSQELDLFQNIESLPPNVTIKRNLIIIKGVFCEVALNLNRGLTVEYYKDTRLEGKVIFGKIEHGYFSNINLLADFYTGHLLVDLRARKKFTDLVKVLPSFIIRESGINLRFTHSSSGVELEKNVLVSFKDGTVKIGYNLNFEHETEGSIRCGFLTVNPEFLYQNNNPKLIVENGGLESEKHLLPDESFDYGTPVSRSITARTALGVTDGSMRLAIGTHELSLNFDQAENAFCGFIQNESKNKDRFLRMYLSAEEVDETYRSRRPRKLNLSYSIKCKKLL